MGTTPEQQKEALATEAAELEADLKEAKTDAAAERVAGNDAAAAKMEAAMAKTQADLDEIKAALKGLADRPFHPAPGDGEAPPATPAEGEQKKEEPAAESEGEQAPKAKRHWMFGDRWNQD